MIGEVSFKRREVTASHSGVTVPKYSGTAISCVCQKSQNCHCRWLWDKVTVGCSNQQQLDRVQVCGCECALIPAYTHSSEHKGQVLAGSGSLDLSTKSPHQKKTLTVLALGPHTALQEAVLSGDLSPQDTLSDFPKPAMINYPSFTMLTKYVFWSMGLLHATSLPDQVTEHPCLTFHKVFPHAIKTGGSLHHISLSHIPYEGYYFSKSPPVAKTPTPVGAPVPPSSAWGSLLS